MHPPEIKQVIIKQKVKEDNSKKQKKQPKGNGVTDWVEVDSNGDEDSEEDEQNAAEYEALLEKQHEEAQEEDEGQKDELSDEDEAGEWITPDNVDKHLLGYTPNQGKS